MRDGGDLQPQAASARVGVYRYSGSRTSSASTRQAEFDDADPRRARRRRRGPVCCCAAPPQIDVIVDVTGSVEFGAHVILEAFKHGKHVVLMNAEVDATIGPILQTYAEKHGVDPVGLRRRRAGPADESRPLGDRPRPDAARDLQHQGPAGPVPQPDDAAGWAERWEQNPAMVTSFADGSKISFEQTIVANATGFKVLQRGMSRGAGLRRLDHGHPSALRHRRAARARRRHRLHGRPGRREGVRARRAHRSRSSATT